MTQTYSRLVLLQLVRSQPGLTQSEILYELEQFGVTLHANTLGTQLKCRYFLKGKAGRWYLTPTGRYAAEKDREQLLRLTAAKPHEVLGQELYEISQGMRALGTRLRKVSQHDGNTDDEQPK